MIEDLNFNNVLEELKRIHDKYPDLRFGSLLQTAIDTQKLGSNTDLHDMSSKQILSCLIEYNKILDESRGDK